MRGIKTKGVEEREGEETEKSHTCCKAGIKGKSVFVSVETFRPSVYAVVAAVGGLEGDTCDSRHGSLRVKARERKRENRSVKGVAKKNCQKMGLTFVELTLRFQRLRTRRIKKKKVRYHKKER